MTLNLNNFGTRGKLNFKIMPLAYAYKQALWNVVINTSSAPVLTSFQSSKVARRGTGSSKCDTCCKQKKRQDVKKTYSKSVEINMNSPRMTQKVTFRLRSKAGIIRAKGLELVSSSIIMMLYLKIYMEWEREKGGMAILVWVTHNTSN